MNFSEWLCHLFHSHGKMAAARLDRVDRESREVKHELRNTRMRTDALHRLISRMRDDGSFGPSHDRGHPQ